MAGLLALPFQVLSAGFESDLNGFRLWQYIEGVEKYYGKPDKTYDQGDTLLSVYQLNKHSYMVFANSKEKFKPYVSSMQITGYPTKMLPFKGLTLGDSRAKVEKALGKPSETKSIEGGKFIVNYYDPANYSTEYDKHDRLYSIKLYVTNEFMKTGSLGDSQWNRFKEAVLKKDIAGIMETLRPDAEIFIGGDTLTHHGRYYDFAKKPDKEFIDALIGPGRSVRTALRKSEATGEMRLAENIGIGQVFKFYDSRILREIVLFPYNGEYRVYEIAFRKKGEEPDKKPH